MDGATVPPHPPGPRPVSGLWVRSALAPPDWSRWTALGIAAIAAVEVAELIVGAHAGIAATFGVVALLVGFMGGRGDAVAVAAVAPVAAALAGLLHGWDTTWTVTLVVVAACSLAAVLVSLLRATAVTTTRQLALLRDLTRLGRTARELQALADTLLDILVPNFADAAALDLAVHGYAGRFGVRVATPDAPRVEEWLRGRPPVDVELPGAQRAIVTGRPWLVEDVDDDLLRTIAVDDADLARLRSLRPRSSLTLPLTTRGAPFGALTLITGPSGRRYSRADLEFAQLVQGRTAIVLDNTELSRAVAHSRAIMSAALDTLEEAVTMNGPDGRTIYVNQAAVRLLKASSQEELLRAEPGEIAGRFAVFDEGGDPVDYRDFPAFRAIEGEEHPDALLVRNVVRETGEERWLLNKVSVLRDADGHVDRVVNVIEDVTPVKQAEVRERLLGEATRVLAESEGRERTLRLLAEVLVPDFADWCAVHLHASAGEDEQAARVGRDAAGGDDVLTLPLLGGGSRLGAITAGRARAFSPDERRMAEELAHRASIAVLNTHLYEERATITRELQHGLRPPELPAVPGLQTATLYRPAGELNDVGGDFFDAFPTAAGWTVCIGDVVGQGARAAALTGLTRYTLRAVAQHTGAQALAMAAVNRALSEESDMALCTLAVLRLHRDGDDVLVSSLSAGHPLPLLVRDGTVRELGAPGPIAGVFPDAAWEPATVRLQEGDTLLLYTDGVVDTVGARDRFGDGRLLALLNGAAGDAPELVARIDGALAAFQTGPQRDDTAIVAVTVRDLRALANALGEAQAVA